MEFPAVPRAGKSPNPMEPSGQGSHERWLTLRIAYYDRRERLVKRFSKGGIERMGGIWTATDTNRQRARAPPST